MANNEHPVTPPPELRRLWAQQAQRMHPHDPAAWMQHVSTQAAQWGADHELKACCALLLQEGAWPWPEEVARLRAARRPKPPSLRQQACDALDTYVYGNPDQDDKVRTYNIIRRALEQLDDTH